MKSKPNTDQMDSLLNAQFNPSVLGTGVSNSKTFSLFSQDNSSLHNVLKYIGDQFIEENKVCVVSIIGKSIMNSMNSKANVIGNLIGHNTFQPKFDGKTCLYKDNFAEIDGYYDINNRIIFLHLTSALDSWALANLSNEMEKQFIEKGFLNVWPNFLTDLFKSLILLFHISHIVIVTSQSPRFDISCINMFRIIDSLRVKLQPFVSEMLQSIPGLPQVWIKSGRLCVPQLLFLFDVFENFQYINSFNVNLYVKQLEDQIFRVLRKSRLISNLNSNSLFTISPSKTFVFISTDNPLIDNYSDYFLKRIFVRCNDEEIGNSVSNYRQIYCNNQAFLNFLLPHINTSLTKDSDNASFRQNSQVELALASNFIKILIALKELIFSQHYPGISTEKLKNLQKIFESLFLTLDIDNRFSEGRCSKMVLNAINFYQENSLSHYTRETHERKLMLALQHFTMQSRGPAIYKYIQVIQSECEKYWNNGHKMCEELSLTGNYCVHKIHRVLHDDYSDQVSETENTKNLPIMAHNSMVKIISACDCGRRQGNREDPFTVKAANYDFYLKMKFKCHTCHNITRIKFPVYDSNFEIDNLSSSQNLTTKSENRDSPLLKSLSQVALSQDELGDEVAKNEIEYEDIQQDVLSIDNFSNNEDLMSLNTDDYYESPSAEKNPIDSNPTGDHNQKLEEPKSDLSPKNISSNSDTGPNEKSDAQKNESISTQSSDNEEQFLSDEEFCSELEIANSPVSIKSNIVIDVKSLPPMIHTLCTDNLPARFSSWSLVCLGPSSIYSHNIGIQDQQGFINGSHFLLPWNVTVMLQHSKNMPPLWEGKRPPGIKHKKTLRDGTQFTVKIFIGVEYECFRGHRFISAGPDLILKTNSNVFKETANDIATSDMPIYMHCACSRPGKSTTLAQLMRIHIVTPKAPIHVTLNPFVQMTPNANMLFNPGQTEPMNLSQSCYWVLRFPMIYESDNGPISYPKEPLSYCRLMKDCYGIADQVTKVNI